MSGFRGFLQIYPVFRKEIFVGPASSRSYAHNLRWFQHCWTRLGYLDRNLRQARLYLSGGQRTSSLFGKC